MQPTRIGRPPRVTIPAHCLIDGINQIVLSPLAGYYGIWLQSVQFASPSVPISISTQWVEVCAGELGPGDRFDQSVQLPHGTAMTDSQIRAFAQQFGIDVAQSSTESLLIGLSAHFATRFFFDERTGRSVPIERETMVGYDLKIGPAREEGPDVSSLAARTRLRSERMPAGAGAWVKRSDRRPAIPLPRLSKERKFMRASDIRLRDVRSVATWDPDIAYARTIEIGERLSSLAIRNGDSATWRGLLAGEADAPPVIGVLDSDFYDGATGIGLFLLALARKTGRADFHEIGRQAFAPLRRQLAARQKLERDERIHGGAEGLASCLYPLVAGAALGECPDLLDSAEQFATQLTQQLIEADRQFDLVAGTSGTILGLLALHDAGRPIGLEKALACGRHFLAHVAPPNSRTKPTRLAGLSHGASGVAVALARLGRASARAEFLDAASSWVAYEDALFDKAHGNWPDLRLVSDAQPNADFTVCSWCHGATGIGFARLGMAQQTGLDMTRAIRRTITEPLADADSLCCGNFGRISFLLEPVSGSIGRS